MSSIKYMWYTLFPLKERIVQNIWRTKTDNQILVAFDESTTFIDWTIELELVTGKVVSERLLTLVQKDLERLDKYILPQMVKRNLFK